MKRTGLLLVAVVVSVLILSGSFFYSFRSHINQLSGIQSQSTGTVVNNDPLALAYMRSRKYPGSNVTVEQTLADNSNYHMYIVSYISDGLKIYALLTVPNQTAPEGGFPVIVFNHGYIAPEQYRSTERYVAYVDYFARNGYIVFKPDYRGNGDSQGMPTGAYYSAAYAIDVLNAISSIKKYKVADPNKIGMWGHSMGGNITLRDLEVSADIKVAVIWGGVVGSYDDLMNNWQRKVPFVPSPRQLELRNNNRAEMIKIHQTPLENPTYWNLIDPFYNINYISAPVQLHHGLSDEEVPVDFSQKLYNKLKSEGKNAEFYTYLGADHNISGVAFNLAMERSLAFFNKYLKI